ncbi:hypothetical protein K3495_g9599 [Podosphaera aphanis]|nr:hypothetical protein K3495_g9599 [Podosphaera aphanis]
MGSPSTSSILTHMANALPTHAREDVTPYVRCSYEAIALFSHSCMIANEFRLIGYDKFRKTEQECSDLAPRLSAKWNERKSKSNTFDFLYVHDKSSRDYFVTIDQVENKAEIRGFTSVDERVARLDITVLDYISATALPLQIEHTPDGQEDRLGLEDKIEEIFVSISRMQDLISLFQLSIIEKLTSNLTKAGGECDGSVPSPQNTHSSTLREDISTLFNPQTAAPFNPYVGPQANTPLPHIPLPPSGLQNTNFIPSRPVPQGEFPPPGFDDEYDILRPTLQHLPNPSRPPFNIGHDDLNPPGLGPRDPLRGSFVGGGGMSGMYPTLNDPLFGNFGPGGRDDRRPGVPEGARYDPLGPGDRPWQGGRPPNPFGGYGRGDFF